MYIGLYMCNMPDAAMLLRELYFPIIDRFSFGFPVV